MLSTREKSLLWKEEDSSPCMQRLRYTAAPNRRREETCLMIRMTTLLLWTRMEATVLATAGPLHLLTIGGLLQTLNAPLTTRVEPAPKRCPFSILTSSSSLGSTPMTPPPTQLQQPSSTFPFFVLSIIFVGCLAMFTSQTKLNVANGHVTALLRNKDEVRSMLRKYETEIRVMDRELSALETSIQSQHRADTQVALVEAQQQRVALQIGEIKERFKRGTKKATSLKELIQSVSQEDVIEKYGPGPQLVELELVFPDFNHRGPTKFIIEMAPVELMPHSVHTFLEMVSAGLLDGCSFILNAMHVVKAAPLPYDGTSAAEKARAFSNKGLESVAFKEYSEDYPHKKHTVGFAADGSPSFYINTEDNSEIHAGDPCFGRVIDGFDAVKRLEMNPTRNGIWFMHRVGIKKAQIVK